MIYVYTNVDEPCLQLRLAARRSAKVGPSKRQGPVGGKGNTQTKPHEAHLTKACAATCVTYILQTKILQAKLPGDLHVCWRISPLGNEILIESNPYTRRNLVRELT